MVPALTCQSPSFQPWMLPRNAPPPLTRMMKRTFGREKDSRTAGRVQTSEFWRNVYEKMGHCFSFCRSHVSFSHRQRARKNTMLPKARIFFSSRLAYLSFFRKVFVKKCFCIIAVAIGLMKKKSFVEKSSFGGCSQKCLSGSHGRRIGHFINPHCLVSGRVWQTKVAVAVFGQELHRALPASTVQFFARALPRTPDSARRARWT